MRVCVISRQRKLIALCRELLDGCGNGAWRLIPCDPGQPPQEADLYVWDYECGVDLSPLAVASQYGRHLLLIHRSDLVRLGELLRRGVCWILLKPVNAATLRSFLEQSSKLAARIESLQDDRDAILNCLLETNLRLQDYDQQRTNFLARAVHDFRAPLTALNGYCGLLLSQQLGPLAGAQIEVLRRMHRSIKRLSRIATATLELSTGRLLELRLERQEIDVQQCVDQALHEMLPLAEEKNLSINVSVEPPVKTLRADPMQIEQVLVNLLDNACKFTPKHGCVEIRGYSCFWNRRNPGVGQAWAGPERRTTSSLDPNVYRFEIADTGPQVPEPYLRHLFQEYTPYGGTRDRSGGGLGLAICRMIVKAHHGDIFAYNSTEGFTLGFILPYLSEDSVAEGTNGSDGQSSQVQEATRRRLSG